ncbi:hypothetical protein AXG93_1502s1060 [Marchantia polymorpha subsp. ruderalis]|uniref:Uncharacterized protein n=1 Tax=Marchantia polymorpha subsp. ruderalis TaxID=1480154 RepID=A0A176WFV2_MARPO|nr:hypothetical protein AXG93_1502s1060 [Marchantia polymorpha subsp. ruderalis]
MNEEVILKVHDAAASGTEMSGDTRDSGSDADRSLARQRPSILFRDSALPIRPEKKTNEVLLSDGYGSSDALSKGGDGRSGPIFARDASGSRGQASEHPEENSRIRRGEGPCRA